MILWRISDPGEIGCGWTATIWHREREKDSSPQPAFETRPRLLSPLRSLAAISSHVNHQNPAVLTSMMFMD